MDYPMEHRLSPIVAFGKNDLVALAPLKDMGPFGVLATVLGIVLFAVPFCLCFMYLILRWTVGEFLRPAFPKRIAALQIILEKAKREDDLKHCRPNTAAAAAAEPQKPVQPPPTPSHMPQTPAEYLKADQALRRLMNQTAVFNGHHQPRTLPARPPTLTLALRAAHWQSHRHQCLLLPRHTGYRHVIPPPPIGPRSFASHALSTVPSRAEAHCGFPEPSSWYESDFVARHRCARNHVRVLLRGRIWYEPQPL